MKWWPTLLFGLAAFFFFDYYSLKEPKKYELLKDGCVVESLYFHHAIQAKEKLDDYIWSRVLCIFFYGMVEGHAVTVFVYKNITWVYDPNKGSYKVTNYPLYDPLMIAEIAFPKLFIKKAYYIEPTLLLQYQHEPSNLVW
jgi:uncharacterized membrane protein YoaT (DUF817 family)